MWPFLSGYSFIFLIFDLYTGDYYKEVVKKHLSESSVKHDSNLRQASHAD
jgi:hypothetical protein